MSRSREDLVLSVGAALEDGDRLEAMSALMANLVVLWGDGGGTPSLDLIHRTIDALAKRELEIRHEGQRLR